MLSWRANARARGWVALNTGRPRISAPGWARAPQQRSVRGPHPPRGGDGAREHRHHLAAQPLDAGLAVRRAQEHLAERGVVPRVDEARVHAELGAALARIAREIARHGQAAV